MPYYAFELLAMVEPPVFSICLPLAAWVQEGLRGLCFRDLIGGLSQPCRVALVRRELNIRALVLAVMVMQGWGVWCPCSGFCTSTTRYA